MGETIVTMKLGYPYPGEVAEDRVADPRLRGLIDTDVEGMLPLVLLERRVWTR